MLDRYLMHVKIKKGDRGRHARRGNIKTYAHSNDKQVNE